MSEQLKGILRWIGYETLIFALWLAGPIRGGADASTSFAVLYIMHAYPIFEVVKRLGSMNAEDDG